MGRESLKRDLARLAVDAACQQLGVHGACPIAQVLVEAGLDRFAEGEEKRGVAVGDRVKAKKRPEAKRDVLSKLAPEERAFPIPFPPVVAETLRPAITKAMVQHVRSGRVVGAGGRTVADIVTRLTKAGINVPRRDRVNGGDAGFVPGESGF